jgi:hypothetical protein
LFTRKSQRGSTTIYEKQKDPSVHSSPCSTISPTDVEKQPEFSPPRSCFSSTSRFEIPIWPFRAHKESPSQAWTLGSNSNSCTLQVPLQVDSNKMQIPSSTNSTNSCTLYYGIKSNEIGDLSLSAIPQSPLDISPRFTSSIPLHSPSHSLTISQQELKSGQLTTHQLSDDRPIRRLPVSPGIGQAPVYVPEEPLNRHHSPTHKIPRGKSGSRELDQSAVSVAVIEVHTETSYHYDPSRTSSSPTVHNGSESVGALDGPGQAVGTSIFNQRGLNQNLGLI